MNLQKLMQYEYLRKSSIRRLMKHNGASIVARDAVDVVARFLGISGVIITKTALSLAKNAKRKKINRADILFAIKFFNANDAISELRQFI
ncbi:MAG: histone-like protein [Promethearchaeota archaeon]